MGWNGMDYAGAAAEVQRGVHPELGCPSDTPVHYSTGVPVTTTPVGCYGATASTPTCRGPRPIGDYDPRGAGELAGTATGYAFVVHGFACLFLVCCSEAC